MTVPGYPSCEDSGVEWLGEIPSHWSVERLKRLCEVFPSSVDKKSYEGQQPVRLCNYTDVYYNEVITGGIEFMPATATDDQIERFALRAGDVVFTKDSETADDIAIAAYVPDDMPGVVYGYHLSVARPRFGVLGAFIKRYFDSAFARACFAVRANGLTRVGLGQYAVDNVEVPTPPLPEQKAIAAFLDRETGKIDALVAEQRRLIELLKEKRQAVISHAVTKGLNPDAPMKPSGIEWLGDVPEHWEVQRLGNLFSEAAEAGEVELPILTVSIHSGVSDREIDPDEMDRRVSRSEDRSKYKCVQPGDLVYNMMRAWQGGFGAVTVPGLVSPAYVVARPRPHADVLTTIIELQLRTPQAVEEMRRHSHGVTDFRLRLYWDEFKMIHVALPPIPEQTDIARFIERESDKIDGLLRETEAAVALLQERRSALISAAVTGKIDVRRLASAETEAA